MAVKLDYVARETAGNLYRNLSIGIATIITVAVSLAQVGVGVMVGDGVRNATARWEGGIEFVVFMQPDATQEQIEVVGAGLADNKRVESFEFFDKAMACEEFRDLFADDPVFVDSVECDVLPTSYRVVPVEKDAEAVEDVAAQFDSQPGVRRVVLASEAIKSFQSFARKINLLIFISAVVLLGAASLLIVNTIRMAVFARRREIEVQKLVGATNWFIRIPFMLEGLVQGLLGAALSCVAVWQVRPYLEELFQDENIPLVAGFHITNTEMAFIYALTVVLGGVIGAVGAGIAVTRFMDV